MDLFLDEEAEPKLFSYEIKQKAGFGKGGEKNFEGTITDLMMHTRYLRKSPVRDYMLISGTSIRLQPISRFANC